MQLIQEQIDKGQEIYQELVTKAWESATFKEQLINNPESTIAEVLGKPDSKIDTKFVVEDQTDNNTIYLNIPRKVNFDDIELSDEQLEIVSGGEIVVLGVAGLGSYLICFGVGLAIGGAAVGVAAIIA